LIWFVYLQTWGRNFDDMPPPILKNNPKKAGAGAGVEEGENQGEADVMGDSGEAFIPGFSFGDPGSHYVEYGQRAVPRSARSSKRALGDSSSSNVPKKPRRTGAQITGSMLIGELVIVFDLSLLLGFLLTLAPFLFRWRPSESFGG
jgi:hypothetical protein